MAVLVYPENWDGKFKKLSFELVSYASKVAEMLGVQAVAVSIGSVDEGELSKLATYGAGRIISIENGALKSLDDQAYTSLIAEVAKSVSASVVVLSNNNTGKALAPRLSVKLKAGIASGVSRLPVSTSQFIVYKKVYSGKAFANVEIKTPVKIITLAQNSFEVIESPKTVAIEKSGIQPDQNLLRTKVTDVQKQTGKILLTDADIVVSGGRGMRSADNWGPLVEMAELLGAGTACSRPVSDEGWRPHDEHTGQTGKIIAPNLYFAIGISGAIQHLAGISSSKYIVAINTDKDAPIFEAAQYGIVGDAAKILPRLVEKLREVKSK
ncbi:MAG: electron transfer flavoprotein subunit alpha [Bacteroidetes bacterium]|nr:MAG: electron transfer flavoprotein subunit alpha [Bacteroidota bacterium]